MRQREKRECSAEGMCSAIYLNVGISSSITGECFHVTGVTRCEKGLIRVSQGWRLRSTGLLALFSTPAWTMRCVRGPFSGLLGEVYLPRLGMASWRCCGRGWGAREIRCRFETRRGSDVSRGRGCGVSKRRFGDTRAFGGYRGRVMRYRYVGSRSETAVYGRRRMVRGSVGLDPWKGALETLLVWFLARPRLSKSTWILHFYVFRRGFRGVVSSAGGASGLHSPRSMYITRREVLPQSEVLPEPSSPSTVLSIIFFSNQSGAEAMIHGRGFVLVSVQDEGLILKALTYTDPCAISRATPSPKPRDRMSQAPAHCLL